MKLRRSSLSIAKKDISSVASCHSKAFGLTNVELYFFTFVRRAS